MKKTLALAALLALAVVPAGCTSDPDPQTTSTVPDWSATDQNPTPAPTLSEEDQAVADAQAALQKREDTRFSCLKDPSNSFPTCYDEVSVGNQLLSDRLELENYQNADYHVTGKTALTLTPLSIKLPEQTGSQQGDAAYAAVVFDVCRDLSDYDKVDATGESQLPSDLDKHPRFLITVVNDTYPNPTKWRVSGSEDAETLTCEV